MNSYQKYRPRNRHGTSGLWALLMGIVFVAFGVENANAQFSFQNRTLLTAEETCPNGVIDPGETNTVRLTIRKTSADTFEQVRVEFVPGTGNVDFTTAVSDLGTFSGGANTDRTADVRFRAGGLCGQLLSPRIRVSWKVGDSRASQEFNFNGGNANQQPFRMALTVQTPYEFSSTSTITINDFETATDKRGRASSYPSKITASGVPNAADPSTDRPIGERLRKLTVTLNNVTHPFAQDLNVILESPWGDRYTLMKQAGGANPLNNTTITFDTDATAGLPASSQINSGSFRTANYNTAELLPAPGNTAANLSEPYLGDIKDLVRISTGQVDARVPNHSNGWLLYVQDDSPGGSGQIAGGWTLKLITEKGICCSTGETFPTITQIRDEVIDTRRPGIADIEINEDAENTDIFFLVGEVPGETAAESIVVSASSSNQGLIENSQFEITRPAEAETRRLRIKKLVVNQSGVAVVTVTATDGSGRSSSTTFNVTIKSVNDAPSISEILGQAANIGQATIEVPFTVTDVESDASLLIPTVSVASDNANLVPVGNVFIRGSGSSRTVQVQPSAGEQGVANITINFTDPGGATGSRTFKVGFETSPGDPTMTPVLDTTVKEDTTKTIPIIVRSASSTPVSSISVAPIESSAPGVIPLSAVSVTGTGTDRNIVITPLANQTSGGVTLKFRVFDPGNLRASTNSFTIAVTAVNDAPVITAIADQTINEDSNTGSIVFTITDVDDLGANLIVTVQSLNTSLVPNSIAADATVTEGIQISGFTGVESLGAITGPIQVANTAGTITIRVKPRVNEFGRAAIRVHVADDDTATSGDNKKGEAERIFSVTVNPVNDPPTATTVTVIAGATNTDNVTLAANIITATGPLGTDADTVTPTLKVKEDPNLSTTSGSVGNPRPIAIRLSGLSGGLGEENDETARVNISVTVDRPEITTLTVSNGSRTPALDQTTTDIRFRVQKEWDGEAIFTVTLTDEQGASTVRKFKLDIDPVNDAPSLADIASRTISKTASGGVTIPISASDLETITPFLTMSTVITPSAAIASAAFDPANARLSLVPASIATLNAISAGDIPVTIVVRTTDRGALDNGDTSGPDYQDPAFTEKSFVLTLSNNQPPTITPASQDIIIDEDGVGIADFTVDDDKALTAISFTALSSNGALVNAGSGVLFNYNTATKVLRVLMFPQPDAAGTTDITIVATDADQLDATGAVKLTVRQVDDSPIITVKKIENISSDNGRWQGSTLNAIEDEDPIDDVRTGSKLIEVDVSDPETASDSLSVTATTRSQDQFLVPNGNIAVSPTGSTRTLTIRPQPNRFGTVQVTVRVTDNSGKSAQETFSIDIAARNDAPNFDAINDVTVIEDSGPRVITLSGVNAGPFENGEDGNAESQTLTLRVRARDAGANSFSTSSSIISGLGDPHSTGVSGSANVTITPIGNAQGTTTLEFTLTDSGSTTGGQDGGGHSNSRTRTITFTVSPVNDAPEIVLASAFGSPEQTEISVPSGGQSGVVSISIRDAEATTGGAADPVKLSDLSVTAVSSNPTLIPNTPTNLELGGAGGSRGLIVRPAVGQFGVATITITVTDKGEPVGTDVKTASKQLTVRVDAGQAPTVSTIPPLALGIGEFSSVIEFTVNDAQTPAGSLAVTATSLNTAAVPQGNIQLAAVDSASPTARRLIIRAGDSPGTAGIRVTVRDADATETTTTFTVTVKGQAPTISSVANQPIPVGGSTGPHNFTIADAETFPGFLQVTRTSSNTAFVPTANVVIGGANGNRTVTVTGAPGVEGSTTITLTVTDNEGQSTSTSFVVSTPTPTNTAPTISAIANQSVQPGQSTSLITFTFSDPETAAAGFVNAASTGARINATSSNSALIPNTNIFLGGDSGTRTVFLTPVAGQTGTSTITVTVTDPGPGDSKSASTAFTVTVAAEIAPTITAIANQTTQVAVATPALAFTITDDSPVANFVNNATTGARVTATSSNTTLVPNANIVLGGNTGSRTVTVTPTAGQSGSSTITITVTDATPGNPQSASTSFTITVQDAAPTISAIANQTTTRGTAVDVALTINDDVTALANLQLSVSSTNPTLVSSGNVTFSGTGTSRTARITPAANQSGTAQLTITVTDAGGKTASREFTLTVTAAAAVEGDINGDGRSDLLFQDNDGFVAAWFMNGVNLSSASFLIPSNSGDPNWRIVATGDFNRDGEEDLLFQHTDGSLAVWYMNDIEMTSATVLSPSGTGDAGWRVRGTGDLDGDGNIDLVFQHTDGTLATWLMTGVTLKSATVLTPSTVGGDASWQIAAVGDVDGNGKLDLVLQHGDGTLGVWFMNGTALVSASLTSTSNPGTGWRVVGATDRNADGKADLLFQNTDGSLGVWFMNGANLTSASLLNPASSGGSWKVVGPK